MVLGDEVPGQCRLPGVGFGVGDELADDPLDVSRRRIDCGVTEQWLEMRGEDRDEAYRQRLEDRAAKSLRP